MYSVNHLLLTVAKGWFIGRTQVMYFVWFITRRSSIPCLIPSHFQLFGMVIRATETPKFAKIYEAVQTSCSTTVTCKRVCIYFLSITITLFTSLRAREDCRYTSLSLCRFHDAPFQYMDAIVRRLNFKENIESLERYVVLEGVETLLLFVFSYTNSRSA